MGEGRRERWVEAGGPAGAVARGSGGEHAEAVRAQPDGGAPCAVEEAGRAQRLTATRRQLWPAAATLEDGCPGRAALAGAPTARPLLPGGAQLRSAGYGRAGGSLVRRLSNTFFHSFHFTISYGCCCCCCIGCVRGLLAATVEFNDIIVGFGPAQFSGVPPPMSTRGGAKMCLRRLKTRLKDGRRSSRRRGSSNCSWLIRARYNTKRRLSSFRGAQI